MDKKTGFKTEKLTVGYSGRAIVEGIDLDFSRGEVTCVIGPNGSGKSTLIKTLAGYIEPLGGSVYIGEREYRDMSSHEMSTILTALLTERPHGELMTVREVISLGRYPYTGLSGRLGKEDSEKVDEVMELFSLTELSDKYFTRLSDGQKQRVLLAKTVCQDTGVILLDEPTSFLDIKYKLELLSLICRLAKEKEITIVMTMHELELVRKFADQIIAVKDGKVDRTGTVQEVFNEEYISGLFDIPVADFRNIYPSVPE